jgi:hypothetical protein
VRGQENYLKLGQNYNWISEWNPSNEDAFILRPADFPVQDTATSQPVSIPTGTNKQFWVTVKVPDDAVPGDYVGRIRLTTAAGSADLGLRSMA